MSSTTPRKDPRGRAVTLLQPLASLAAAGLLRYLPRAEGPAWRGTLALYAHPWLSGEAAGIYGPPKGEQPLEGDGVLLAALRSAGFPRPSALPLGAVVGLCELVAVHQGADGLELNELELLVLSRASGGRPCALWELSGTREIHPVPCANGGGGLWVVPEGVGRALNEAVVAARVEA